MFKHDIICKPGIPPSFIPFNAWLMHLTRDICNSTGDYEIPNKIPKGNGEPFERIRVKFMKLLQTLRISGLHFEDMMGMS
jgi:hypothetical protein